MTSSTRNEAKTAKLLAELEHANVLDALSHAKEMRSALRVICTWAGVPGALDAQDVRRLCEKALKMNAKGVSDTPAECAKVETAPPAREKYGPKQIAKELMATALGKAYYGNALYVAKDIPVLTDEERFVLLRWLDGSQCGTDWRELQLIAHKISCDA